MDDKIGEPASSLNALAYRLYSLPAHLSPRRGQALRMDLESDLNR